MEFTKLDKVLNLNLDKHRPLAFFGIKAHESHGSIIDWVKWCKRQGFRGFNIIIASDCMGRANESWINMVLDSYETALKTAKEEGLEVWIFDDWGYPSGTAGGLVCTEDSYRAKKLVISHNCILKKGERISLTMPDNLVSAGILKNNTFERLNTRSKEPFEYVCEDDYALIVVVSWDYDEHASKSSCKSYPGDPAMSCMDMLNPKATKKFLSVMHDRHYQRFSEYFGDVIKGFFYDEPYLRFDFPYSQKLFEVFQKKKGYDLLEILPYLLVNINDNQPAAIKEYIDDFFDVYTDMVADNFYRVLSQWCSEHGVELSGHMDLDHHLNTLNTISGHFFKNMQYNSRPAIDVIWAQIEPGVFTDFPRYAGSVKRILGRKHAVSETFAGMGQGLHGDLMRYITDHQVIRGIDDFHLMYSNNSPDDPSESPQMPNHMLQEPFGKLIYERMAAASAISCYGMSAGNTAVYVPCYDLYRAQLSIGQLTVNNAEKFIWEWVNDIARELTYMPCDFDYIWDEAILMLELTEGGLLTGSGHIIDTIILPPNCTIKNDIAKKLKLFSKAGGRIISVFRYNPLLEQEAILCSELTSLRKYIDTPVAIAPKSKISLCTRIGEDKTVYMLLNESLEDSDVEICINNNGALYEASLRDGSLTLVSQEGPFKFSTQFDGCGMKVFITDTKGTISSANNIFYTDSVHRRENCIEPFDWRVVLPDKKEVKLDGKNWPDWTSLGWPEYSGFMKYTSYFDYDCDQTEAILYMPELHYHAAVYVDGKEAGKVAYKPYELVLSGLSKGRHKLEIEVYNTGANQVVGTIEAEKKKYSKRFAHMAAHDRKWLKSGLLGRVTIHPAD
ncbi:MAG: glycoside hydrolase family 2 [Clostridiaceae bacterium]|nr:glycoside hydrolase family 2 [Clostridiaceae bacterium]